MAVEAVNTMPSPSLFARFVRLVSLGVVWLSGAMVLGFLVNLLERGGFSWIQGDWLINIENIHVRRGPLGSLLIRISDATGVDLLLLLGAVQGGVMVLLLLACTAVLWRLLRDPTFALIVFSPAVFFVFWMANPRAIVRKEMLVFTALALLLLIPMRPALRWVLAGASLLLYLLAVSGHEAMTLMFPAWAAVLLVVMWPWRDRPLLWVMLGLGALAALAKGLYAIRFRGIDDVMPVCAPLLERGLGDSYCGGSIKWLIQGPVPVLERFGEDVPVFLVGYVLASIPLFWLAIRHPWRGPLLLGFFGLLVPVLPLYPIAWDWGRWMLMHGSAFASLLMAAYLVHPRIAPRARLPARILSGLAIVGICAGNLFWAPQWVHVGLNGGVAEQFRENVPRHVNRILRSLPGV